LETPAVTVLLAGRGVVDLTTGTPAEARAAQVWFTARGARYLDGAILCGVRDIGTPQGLLLYSGDETVFQGNARVLAALGGAPRFVGPEVGAAAVLDMAWLTRIALDYVGLYQGAAVCRAEGVAIDHFAAVFNDGATQSNLAPLLTNAFGNATANVTVWNKAAKRMAASARDAGTSPAVPDLVVDILTRTEAAGFGHQRMAAMVKVLGRPGDFPGDE
jgi:3-hydroxyisobutyrate dehydrogenase-like beta-hydroxyacid dehydrogenase